MPAALSPELVERLREGKRRGLSPRRLARQFGVSKKTAYLHTLDIPLCPDLSRPLSARMRHFLAAADHGLDGDLLAERFGYRDAASAKVALHYARKRRAALSRRG
jgi:hypothetical protein